MRLLPAALCVSLLLSGCAEAPRPPVRVAAASNLSRAIGLLTAAFRQSTGIPVVASFGATAQLATQIANGAPFDVYLAGDRVHAEELTMKKLCGPSSVYALGRLAVWTAGREQPARPSDLLNAKVIALARPELAPYGAAAVEALRGLGLWDRLQPRLVYSSSVSTAKQYADTGNADAAFTALSLVVSEPGHYFVIDRALHHPIEQALCSVNGSAPSAARFAEFVLSAQGRAILTKAGYEAP